MQAPTSAPTVEPSSALAVFLLLTGSDEDADEVDAEIVGPFASRDDLIEAISTLPAWVLPSRKENGE